jgi:N-acetylneuraminic acid mutarotase
MKLSVISKLGFVSIATVFFAIESHASEVLPPTDRWPSLPEGVTSFGAEPLEDAVYVYGGHIGKAHHYSVDTTLGSFMRLKLDGKSSWEKLAGGSRVQGSRLVAYDGAIYRVGGLQPRDRADGKVGLHSLTEFVRYDVETDRWENLVTLPVARSSHEATIVGSKVYVAGGWKMTGQGSQGEYWHDAMHVIDLAQSPLTWKTIPQPFKRRAISSDVSEGKIYFMGGMDSEGETSRAVDVYDTVTGEWSVGPELPFGPMVGFGSAACTLDDRVIVSPYSSEILTLNGTGTAWVKIGELAERRFFHRIIPLPGGNILALAGASRKAGHLASLEVVELVGRN